MLRIIRLTPQEWIEIDDDGNVELHFIDPDIDDEESFDLLIRRPNSHQSIDLLIYRPDLMTDEEIIKIYMEIFHTHF